MNRFAWHRARERATPERTAPESNKKEQRGKNWVDPLERVGKNLRPVFTSAYSGSRGDLLELGEEEFAPIQNASLKAGRKASRRWRALVPGSSRRWHALVTDSARISLAPGSSIALAGTWFFGPHRDAGLGRSDCRRPHEVDRSMSFWVSVCMSVGGPVFK